MGTFLSNAAKTVTFVILKNSHFLLARSLAHDSMMLVLLSRLLIFVKLSVVTTGSDLSNSEIFSCA